MRVKRYVVDTMPEALQKIRVDLGKDAVIINTKAIKTGGFLGMFSKKKIEVIAAIDSSSGNAAGTKPPPPATSPPSGVVPPSGVAPPSAASLQQTAKHAVAAAYGAQRKGVAADSLAFPEVPDVLPPAFMLSEAEASTFSTPTVTRVPSTAVPLERTQAAAAVLKTKEDMLLEEMKQMKELMHKLSMQHGEVELPNPSIERYERRLLEQEVDPLLVKELLANVHEQADNDESELTDIYVKQSLTRQLLAILATDSAKPIAADTRIAHFVGPTGVGKTTTIAKLAAEQVLKYQRKVGFITSDTYRIAAVEQLKTYATILNVPLEVVFSPLDLMKSFDNLKDCDLIFMDTAGRNFRNEMYVSELNALLRASGKSETFLVLSLTTKYKDMKAITTNFSKFKLHKVLFTKMDETDSFGAIPNLIREFGLQTSYIANGQSVPDDIEVLQEQQIIDLLLEDNNHE
ncbi:flagellar biosynthesis protein FlhF [Paenibacillus sp. YYML68]|uniref:flagellar biosynthesis protein FlhF n=1 Tax=Paenibacillus sp. YYML68 TaxID=2909250 RepID=UPI00249136FF|nr:flagellar biosynthesis protein FlhF [Paenibacillus sp. YYML68]